MCLGLLGLADLRTFLRHERLNHHYEPPRGHGPSSNAQDCETDEPRLRGLQDSDTAFAIKVNISNDAEQHEAGHRCDRERLETARGLLFINGSAV